MEAVDIFDLVNLETSDDEAKQLNDRFTGMAYLFKTGWTISIYDNYTEESYWGVMPTIREVKAWQLAQFWADNIGMLIPVEQHDEQ